MAHTSQELTLGSARSLGRSLCRLQLLVKIDQLRCCTLALSDVRKNTVSVSFVIFFPNISTSVMQPNPKPIFSLYPVFNIKLLVFSEKRFETHHYLFYITGMDSA